MNDEDGDEIGESGRRRIGVEDDRDERDAAHRDLADWHPLISGDPESVHRAGVSVRGQTINETVLAEPEDALDFAAPDLIPERGRD